jgi:hypothetical protein
MSAALAMSALVNAVAGEASAAAPAMWLTKWRRDMPAGTPNRRDMMTLLEKLDSGPIKHP